MRSTAVPGEQFYLSVRAGFCKIGSSLTEWCRDNGYKIQNVRSACYGAWEGPRAREIRAEIVSYLADCGVSDFA